MTDELPQTQPTQEIPVAPAPPEAAPPVGAPTDAESLRKSLRRHRIWLIVITVVMSLLLIVNGFILLMTWGIGAGIGMSGPEVGDAAVKQAEQEIRGAYGSRVKDIDVRTVKMDYGMSISFPFSLMAGESGESLYASYRLKDSKVVFANVLIEGLPGEDIAAMGMLPTKGPLSSRMTEKQLNSFLKAYAAETSKPLGGITRYGQGRYALDTGSRVPEEIRVGDKSYATDSLWSAVEGKVVTGDKVDMDLADEMGTNVLVFEEDAKTGEFTCLGSDSSYGM